jgi:hypothetical protein
MGLFRQLETTVKTPIFRTLEREFPLVGGTADLSTI